MKTILITGVNSYVGNSLTEWLIQCPELYHVDKISLRDESWKEKDFSNYDSIVHVAGIAHVSTDPNMEEKYYKVNTDLTIEVAKKAKTEGVAQFIFLSSIIVYGDAAGECGIIDINTKPKPSDFYGNSKLKAEKGLLPYKDESFQIAIVRPPMIYGKGSKGNYPKLAKLAKNLPLFPNINNKRSMLHIDNLCEFIKLLIDNKDEGLFFPQNREYVNTSEMASVIAETYGKRLKLVKIFNPILIFMRKKVGIINKVFGNLAYDKSLSEYKCKYQIRDFKRSIQLTESRE